MLDEKLEELLRNKEIVEKEEVKHYEEHKSQIKEMEEKLNRIKMTKEKMIQITLGEKTEEWSTVVKRNVDKELKAINEKVKKVEESIERNIEEEKLRERKKINILHRLAEKKDMEHGERISEDKRMVLSLLNDVLEVPCNEKLDIKNIYRFGKYKEGEKERPLLIEFRNVANKNRALELLSRLQKEEEKFKRISVTHDIRF